MKEQLRSKKEQATINCCYAKLSLEMGHGNRAAEDLYLGALQEDPEHVEALFGLGQLCEMDNEPRKAEAYYRRVLDVELAHPDANFSLGSWLEMEGKINEAESCFRRVVEAAQENIQALYRLAAILVRLGRKKEAESFFLRATNLTRAKEVENRAKVEACFKTVSLLVKAGQDPGLNYRIAFDIDPEYAAELCLEVNFSPLLPTNDS